MSLCSCDYDGDGERAEFFRVATPKASKSYFCCECGVVIARGESHEYIVAKWEGAVNSFRTCSGCAELREASCQEVGYLWSRHNDWLEDVEIGNLDDLSPVGQAKLVEMFDRIFAAYNDAAAKGEE